MRLVYFYLAALSATARAEDVAKLPILDPLKFGHSPEKVFVPTEKEGMPVLKLGLEKRPRHGDKPSAVPLHVEQMVDFKDTPVQEQANGFVVIG